MAIGGAQELLQFLITANGQQAIKEINAVGAAATRQEQILAKQNKKSAAAYTALGAKQLGFGLVLGAGITAAAAAAADLDKSVSRVNATFGEGADSVRQWAENANEVFLSDRQAASYAANVGEAAQGLGLAADESARLVPAVLDVTAQLAVLKGLDMQNSIESIAAALRGEFDATQKLVPALSAARIQREALAQAGKENVKDLTTAEKAYATLNIILEDGEQIVAGNAEALDSLSAKWAKTRSEIDDTVVALGGGALPAVEGAAGVLGTVAEAAGRIPSPLLTAAGAVTTLGAGLSAGAGVVNLARGGYEKLGGSLTALGNAAIGAKGEIGSLGARLTVGGAAAVAAAVGLDAIGRAMNRSNDYAGQMERALSRVEKGYGKLDEARNYVQAAQDDWRGLDDVAASFGDTLDGIDIEYWEEFADLAPVEDARKALQDLRAELESTAGDQPPGWLADTGQFFGIQSLKGDLEDVDDLLERVNQRAADERAKYIIEVDTGDSEDSLEGVEAAAENAADAVEEYESAIRPRQEATEFVDANLAVAEALNDIAKAQRDLAEVEGDPEADELDKADARAELARKTRDLADAEQGRLDALNELSGFSDEQLFGQIESIDALLADNLISQSTADQWKADIAFSIEQGASDADPAPEVNLEKMNRSMDAWADRLTAQAPDIPVGVDPAKGEAEIAGLLSAAEAGATVPVAADTGSATAEYNVFYDLLTGELIEVPVGADTRVADTRYGSLEQRIEAGTVVPVDADTSPANAAIDALGRRKITISVQARGIDPGLLNALPGPGIDASGLEAGALAGSGSIPLGDLLTGLSRSTFAAGAGSGASVGTYVNSQTINLPRGADAREIEAAQRRHAARNGNLRR